MMQMSIMRSKKNATYVRKGFVVIKIEKWNLIYTVRDHCHFTGKCREAADSICNLNYKVPQEISVKIHNIIYNNYHNI